MLAVFYYDRYGRMCCADYVKACGQAVTDEDVHFKVGSELVSFGFAHNDYGVGGRCFTHISAGHVTILDGKIVGVPQRFN